MGIIFATESSVLSQLRIKAELKKFLLYKQPHFTNEETWPRGIRGLVGVTSLQQEGATLCLECLSQT